MTITRETREVNRAKEDETLGSRQSIELVKKKFPAFYITRN